MPRKLLIALLVTGTVGGYALAGASWYWHRNHPHAVRHHGDRHEKFEQHIAEVCLRAADRLAKPAPTQ